MWQVGLLGQSPNVLTALSVTACYRSNTTPRSGTRMNTLRSYRKRNRGFVLLLLLGFRIVLWCVCGHVGMWAGCQWRAFNSPFLLRPVLVFFALKAIWLLMMEEEVNYSTMVFKTGASLTKGKLLSCFVQKWITDKSDCLYLCEVPWWTSYFPVFL